jgi:hypothetical protein
VATTWPAVGGWPSACGDLAWQASANWLIWRSVWGAAVRRRPGPVSRAYWLCCRAASAASWVREVM